MENLNASIKEILEFAFAAKAGSLTGAREFLKAFSSEHISILNLKDNTIFIDSHSQLDNIFVQIKGTTYVIKYTLDGRRIIAATFSGAQIFGLIEAINGARTYKGTVVTLSESLLVKVNKDDFLKAVYNDTVTASIIVKYLADFSTQSIEAFENKAAISPFENLIIYLYNKTLGKRLPFAIKDNKAFIADLLQINKRSLYRYLNKLSEEGIISRDRQAIIISADNFAKIEKLFGTIHNK